MGDGTTDIGQHFVQAAYLKAWQCGDGLFYARNIPAPGPGWIVHRKSEPPSAVGKLTNYFTTDRPGFGPEWFEAQFQIIENEGLPEVRKIRLGQLPNRQGSRRRASRYFAMSMLRSLGFREWSLARKDLQQERFYGEWAEELEDLYDTEEERREHVSSAHRTTFQTRPIEMVDAAAVLLALCEWRLLEAPVGSWFTLGDGYCTRITPVALGDAAGEMVGDGFGIKEFLAPLSPTTALLFLQTDRSRSLLNHGTGVLDLTLDDGPSGYEYTPTTVLSERAIEAINLTALVQSHEFLFSHSRRHLEKILLSRVMTRLTRTALYSAEYLLPLLGQELR